MLDVLSQDRGAQCECGLRYVIRPGPSRILDFVVLDELRKRTGIIAEVGG
jgi:hypothetical protein